MHRLIFAFVGKKRDLQRQLAAAVARESGVSNVVYLDGWKEKKAAKVAARKQPNPTIA